MSDHHFKATGQQAFQVVQLERQYNDLIFFSYWTSNLKCEGKLSYGASCTAVDACQETKGLGCVSASCQCSDVNN